MRRIRIAIKINIKEVVKEEGETGEMEGATAEEAWVLGSTADVMIAVVGNSKDENKRCH